MIETARLFDLAIEMERAGSRLYGSLAEKHVRNEDLRSLFEFLAAEEDGHEKLLWDIRTGLVDAAIPGFDDFRPSKVQAFISVFSPTRLSDERRRITDLDSAVDFAIRREMDSVFLYHEIETAVPEHVKPHVRKLIADEREHFSRLAGLRAARGV